MGQASSSDDLWVVRIPGEDALLYASWDGQRIVEVEQRVLPGWWSLVFPSAERTTMKGVFAGGSAKNASYKGAIDGFSAVDGMLLRDAILAAIQSGAAVQLSLTRDWGALVVTVLDGNDRHKVYPTDAGEITQTLIDLRESYTTEAPPAGTRAKAR